MTGFRHLGLRFFVLIGVLAVVLAAPDQAAAMSSHAGHAMAQDAPSDAGKAGPAMQDHAAHHADLGHEDGGCPRGMMASCCVMTCCAATVPEIAPGAVRHLVSAARSSRPIMADGRAILPPLKPPKRVS